MNTVNIPSQYKIGWLGAVCFGLAGTINFFNLGPVLQMTGNIGILLFIVGMLIALISGVGWLAIVLQHPHAVGGATVNSYSTFAPRSSLLLTILCFANWFSWVAQATLSSILCAAALIQWFSITGLSETSIAIFILLSFIMVGLLPLNIASRIIIPAAGCLIIFAVLSGILPLLFGKGSLDFSHLLNTQLPFSGWFGYLTAIMSGFYLVGWIVPAYEVTTWLTGEMHHPKKQLPIAFIITAFVSILTFIVLPVIWLNTVGYSPLTSNYMSGTNLVFFSKLFPGFGSSFASFSALIFIISSMICSGIGSIVGPSRMLVQLSEYGLFPYFYQKRLKNGVPWLAVGTTGLIAITLVILQTPLWLIAATNFGYLASMILASVGAWLMTKDHPEKFSMKLKKIITLGLFFNIFWIASIIFGFQQYGMVAMLGGVLFSLLGAIPYLFHKVSDIYKQGEKINFYSIKLKLPLIFFLVMLLNSGGYLLMLMYSKNDIQITTLLQDIFILVILLTITIGLWISDSVAHTAVQIAKASRQLSKEAMTELVIAMKALGEGIFNHVSPPYKKIILPSQRKDELGLMIKSFSDLEDQIELVFKNVLSTKIKLRDSDKILQMNAELEKRVMERTKELKETQQKLVVIARQAGMADVATSVLHNIGNALNSVKVTLILLQENINDKSFKDFLMVIDLLKENMNSLTHFLTMDEKGKLVPNYLVSLSDVLEKNRETSQEALKRITDCVQHIEDIVDMQRGISGVTGMIEKVFLPDVIENAIQICTDALEKSQIKLDKDFVDKSYIMTDKTKVIQILVNLIKNAQDAVETAQGTKKIKISIKKISDSLIHVTVTDNGIGVKNENLTKIFSLGFTTKTTGHGFGLHSSAIAAIEMGGSLQVQSIGEGKGATFILALPLTKNTSLI